MRAQVLGHSSLYRILPKLPAFILIPCTSTCCKIKKKQPTIKWGVKKETQVNASILGNVLQQWPYAKKGNPWDAMLCAGTALLGGRGGQSGTALAVSDSLGHPGLQRSSQRNPGKTKRETSTPRKRKVTLVHKIFWRFSQQQQQSPLGSPEGRVLASKLLNI